MINTFHELSNAYEILCLEMARNPELLDPLVNQWCLINRLEILHFLERCTLLSI